MANLKYKTRGDSNPQGKPRVYFCCHPEDINKYFESVFLAILIPVFSISYDNYRDNWRGCGENE